MPQDVLAQEQERFVAEHPRSKDLFEQARGNLFCGVPMSWMTEWAGAFPVFVEEASGAHFVDVDGHRYLDLCLGDTGAMTGHAPKAAVDAITEQIRRGVTFMLPTEDAVWVGQELVRRFGLPFWQTALTATDANRFAIRLARYTTGRKLILVFNFCYHGTVDEALITLADGIASSREGNAGPAIDPAVTTRVVELNDIPALEAALAPGDVACVLAEPVMTNIGIVHPEPGYHAALREITHRTGTLLIMDETHTICAGPGGYTRTHGLQPDMMTLGKPIASGVPVAVYGFTAEVANRIRATSGVGDDDKFDVHGIGGTLAGNALSMAAMRVTLEQVLTQGAYDRMFPLAQRLVDGVQSAIEEYQLPWHITRLGCRAEYWFRPTPPRNGTEANAYVDTELAGYMHLAALNRGIMLTPFHNMALISPDTTEVDIDRHTQVFRESVEALVA
ncbi:MAG: aspartate aminotransferase family protein [Anaerolineae bacterium]